MSWQDRLQVIVIVAWFLFLASLLRPAARRWIYPRAYRKAYEHRKRQLAYERWARSFDRVRDSLRGMQLAAIGAQAAAENLSRVMRQVGAAAESFRIQQGGRHRAED